MGALLNAQSLGAANFGMSATEVIDMFNAAYPGSKSDYTTLQNTFESLTDVNGRVCPLN